MDKAALIAIVINLYLTIPQCLGAGASVLILLKPQVSGRLLRLSLYSLAYALFCSFTYFLAIEHGMLTPRVVLLIAFDYFLFRRLFRFDAPLAQVAATISTLAIVISTLGGTLIATASGAPLADFYTMKPSLRSALAWYPFYAAIPLIIWRWRQGLGQKLWAAIESLYKYPMAQAVFWLLIVQLALMGGGFMSVANHMADETNSALLLLSLVGFIIMLLSTLLLCHLSLQMARRLHTRSLGSSLFQQTEELMHSVETQRESFMAAMGRLAGLAEQGRNAELGDSLDNVARELDQVNRRLMTGNTLLSAVLNAKIIQAEKCGVQIHLDLQAPLNGPAIERNSLEMIRIMGNLLDNALDAVRDMKAEHRWVRVQSTQAGPLQSLKISNPLSEAASVSDALFEPGYTSKGGSHSGLGLYIAHSLADGMGGQLKFQIEAGPVLSFVLILPR